MMSVFQCLGLQSANVQIIYNLPASDLPSYRMLKIVPDDKYALISIPKLVLFQEKYCFC